MNFILRIPGKQRLLPFRQIVFVLLVVCRRNDQDRFLGGEVSGLAPMATTMAWGLSFATILILYIVPAAYALMDDLINLVYRLFRSKPEWVRPDLDALDELDRLDLKQAGERSDQLFDEDGQLRPA